jgi:fructokinase
VGTGVGLGLIVNGKMVHGMMHPEGGHIRVPILKDDESFKGVCIYHGNCLEGLCTNVSIASRLGVTVEELQDVE